jgi:hypothetical protein
LPWSSLHALTSKATVVTFLAVILKGKVLKELVQRRPPPGFLVARDTVWRLLRPLHRWQQAPRYGEQTFGDELRLRA